MSEQIGNESIVSDPKEGYLYQAKELKHFNKKRHDVHLYWMELIKEKNFEEWIALESDFAEIKEMIEEERQKFERDYQYDRDKIAAQNEKVREKSNTILDQVEENTAQLEGITLKIIQFDPELKHSLTAFSLAHEAWKQSSWGLQSIKLATELVNNLANPFALLDLEHVIESATLRKNLDTKWNKLKDEIQVAFSSQPTLHDMLKQIKPLQSMHQEVYNQLRSEGNNIESSAEKAMTELMLRKKLNMSIVLAGKLGEHYDYAEKILKPINVTMQEILKSKKLASNSTNPLSSTDFKTHYFDQIDPQLDQFLQNGLKVEKEFIKANQNQYPAEKFFQKNRLLIQFSQKAEVLEDKLNLYSTPAFQQGLRPLLRFEPKPQFSRKKGLDDEENEVLYYAARRPR